MCAPLVMQRVERGLSRRAFLAGGLGLLGGLAQGAPTPVPGKAFSRVWGLTHEFSLNTPLFPGAEPMRITTLVTVRQNGHYGNRLDLWEHTGTHMDGPAHFVDGGATAEKLPPFQLIAPLAVIHIHEKAAKDPDARDTLHFPGFSPEAAEFRVREREIVGVGVDTLPLDFGPSQDFRTHPVLLGAGKYGLENLAGLGQVPPQRGPDPRGAPKHQGASRERVRALAVW